MMIAKGFAGVATILLLSLSFSFFSTVASIPMDARTRFPIYGTLFGSNSTERGNNSKFVNETANGYGWSCSVGQGLLAIGAPFQWTRNQSPGLVYLYNKDETGFKYFQHLLSPKFPTYNTDNEQYGVIVAVSAFPGYGFGNGNHIAVAARGFNNSAALVIISVYSKQVGRYGYTGNITSSEQDIENGYLCGRALALRNNSILVGCPRRLSSGPGKVIMYSILNEGTNKITTIESVDEFNGTTARFGRSVAFSPNGEYFIVGSTTNAIIFSTSTRRSIFINGSLIDPVESVADFGHSVAISDTIALVGDPYKGIAVFYDFDFVTGTAVPIFNVTGQSCGYSVTLSEDMAVIGCPLYEPNGLVYIAEKIFENVWELTAYLNASDGDNNLGWSVSIYNGSVVIGNNQTVNTEGVVRWLSNDTAPNDPYGTTFFNGIDTTGVYAFSSNDISSTTTTSVTTGATGNTVIDIYANYTSAGSVTVGIKGQNGLNDLRLAFSIRSIIELDSDFNPVATVSSDTWTLRQEAIGTLRLYSGPLFSTTGRAMGSLELSYNLLDNQTTQNFANLSLTYPKSTLKLSIRVLNWNFTSARNSLQILITSQSNQRYNVSQDVVYPDGPESYASVRKQFHGGILYQQRFLNTILLDGVAQSLQNFSLVDLTTLSVVVPSFNRLVVINPDISLIALYDYGDTNRTLLIVIVSSVGGVLLTGTVALVALVIVKRRIKAYKRHHHDPKEADSMLSIDPASTSSSNAFPTKPPAA